MQNVTENGNKLRDTHIYDKRHRTSMGNKIMIDTEKFKEILLHSWDLLPSDKQQELLNMGIYPKNKA